MPEARQQASISNSNTASGKLLIEWPKASRPWFGSRNGLSRISTSVPSGIWIHVPLALWSVRKQPSEPISTSACRRDANGLLSTTSQPGSRPKLAHGFIRPNSKRWRPREKTSAQVVARDAGVTGAGDRSERMSTWCQLSMCIGRSVPSSRLARLDSSSEASSVPATRLEITMPLSGACSESCLATSKPKRRLRSRRSAGLSSDNETRGDWCSAAR